MNNNPIVKQVAAMGKGDALEVERSYLCEHVKGFQHKGSWFSPADRVLENIVGSAYEYNYTENAYTGNVTFYRLTDSQVSDRRTYTSPDRR